MPENMNNPYGQQGWDASQYPAQQYDAYGQPVFNPQDMQSQQMYQQMGAQPGYPQQYPDPNAQYGASQGMYYDPMQQAYEAEAEAERMARQAQMRAGSNFGPKMGAAAEPAMDYAQMGAAQGMPQMGAAQAQQPQMTMPQMQPTPQQQAVPQPAPQPAPQVPQAPQATAYQGTPSNAKAIISLVLGILSIVFALIPPIGMVLGWVSTRLAKKYIKAGGTSGAGDAGRIFGKVGFAFSFLMLIVLGGMLLYIAGATFGNYGARSLAIYFNNSPLGHTFGMFPIA